MAPVRVRDVSELKELKEGEWCVVGRGRSLDLYPDRIKNLVGMNMLGVNDVQIPGSESCLKSLSAPAVSIVNDYENWTDFPAGFAPRLLVPYYPHWRYGPCSGPIENFLFHDRRLRELAIAGGMFCYDLCSIKDVKRSPFPTVEAFAGCTEAAVNLLRQAGHHVIYFLGVDIWDKPNPAKQFRGAGQIDVMMVDGVFRKSATEGNNHRMTLIHYIQEMTKKHYLEIINLATGKDWFSSESVLEQREMVKKLDEQEGITNGDTGQ